MLVQKIEPELYFLQVRFGPDEAFYLLNRKGDKLRTISIKNIETLVVDVTQDTNGHRGGSGKKPMALVRVNKEHDLVLEFGYPGERKKFLAKLENFLSVRLLLLLKVSWKPTLSSPFGITTILITTLLIILMVRCQMSETACRRR